MRCDFCFKEKPVYELKHNEKLIAKVCKACGYEIDKVEGFIEMQTTRLVNITTLQADKKKGAEG